jgi:hypothetical protein
MDYYGLMPSSLRLLAAPLLACSLAACAVQAQNTPPATSLPTASAPTAQENGAELDAELFYEIFTGELSARSGDPGAGYSLLLEAARRNQDEKLFQRATAIALRRGCACGSARLGRRLADIAYGTALSVADLAGTEPYGRDGCAAGTVPEHR